jgi:hypothetical protein
MRCTSGCALLVLLSIAPMSASAQETNGATFSATACYRQYSRRGWCGAPDSVACKTYRIARQLNRLSPRLRAAVRAYDTLSIRVDRITAERAQSMELADLLRVSSQSVDFTLLAIPLQRLSRLSARVPGASRLRQHQAAICTGWGGPDAQRGAEITARVLHNLATLDDERRDARRARAHGHGREATPVTRFCEQEDDASVSSGSSGRASQCVAEQYRTAIGAARRLLDDFGANGTVAVGRYPCAFDDSGSSEVSEYERAIASLDEDFSTWNTNAAACLEALEEERVSNSPRTTDVEVAVPMFEDIIRRLNGAADSSAGRVQILEALVPVVPTDLRISPREFACGAWTVLRAALRLSDNSGGIGDLAAEYSACTTAYQGSGTAPPLL